MDRRYKESRFYNNVRASNDGEARAERLLNMYKSRFNAESKKAQTYGGSTGGTKSTDPDFGRKVLSERAAEQKAKRKIFDIEGRGEYGARREFGKDYTQARDPDWKPDSTDAENSLNAAPKRRYTGNIFEDSDAFRPSEDEEDK